MKHRLVHRMNITGQEPDWLDGREWEQGFRWCFKGGGSTQPADTTTKQTTEPWSELRPYLEYGYGEAKQQYQGDKPQYFPDSTVAPFDPATVAAQNMTAGRALQGSPEIGAASGELQQTLGGDYLKQGNPYLGGVMDNIESTVLPAVDSRFAQAGRFGSGLHADTATRAATEAMSPYAFGAYGDERNRMMSATQMAPGMAQAGYGDFDRLAGVGLQREQMAQANLEDEINRFNFDQNVDSQKLAEYMALVGGGSPGGTTTGSSTQPVYRGK